IQVGHVSVAVQRPPAIGENVRVRSRRYLVEEVNPPPTPGDDTLVRLSCLEDDAEGEELRVLWEREVDAERIDEADWSKLTKGEFDPVKFFAAYYRTLRWNTVTSTDPTLLPSGTRAASVFLVNRREALEGLDDLKDERFIFQASLTVESDRPFVPRPNPRGHEHHDPDERIADLQYRDTMEFAVGHGTSVHGVMTGRECRAVQTTWMPQCEVERVEPAELKNVELGMEALAATPDGGSLRAALSSPVA